MTWLKQFEKGECTAFEFAEDAYRKRAGGEAMDRVDEFGVGAVGVHDSNHLSRLDYYTDQLRREGYVEIATINTEPAMPPKGGADPVLGTNPIAVGLPTDPRFTSTRRRRRSREEPCSTVRRPAKSYPRVSRSIRTANRPPTPTPR